MTTTLLAVDDSVTMRKVLEITFAGENFKTILASSGQEALALAKAQRPNLVLLDHTLPDMSGYDLARELKSAVPSVAILILSSKLAPYDKARGAATGVDDFMDKPFDTQKLLDKVGQVLSQPRAAAVAPQAVAPPASVLAAERARTQTLAYGTVAATQPAPSPAAPAAATRTLTGTPAATPKPGVSAAGPRLAHSGGFGRPAGSGEASGSSQGHARDGSSSSSGRRRFGRSGGQRPARRQAGGSRSHSDTGRWCPRAFARSGRTGRVGSRPGSRGDAHQRRATPADERVESAREVHSLGAESALASRPDGRTAESVRAGRGRSSLVRVLGGPRRISSQRRPG